MTVVDVGTCVLLFADETDTDSGARAWLDDRITLLLSTCGVLMIALALSVGAVVALGVSAVDEDTVSESLVQSACEVAGGEAANVDGLTMLVVSTVTVLGAGGGRVVVLVCVWVGTAVC